jgi:hypothetical protein
MFYKVCIGEPPIPNSCKSWKTIFGNEVDWNKIFVTTKKIHEIKMKWFQMKIYYRILVTNSMLTRMKVIENNKCSFCNMEKGSIFHYLWDCLYVQNFWKDFDKCLKDNCM